MVPVEDDLGEMKEVGHDLGDLVEDEREVLVVDEREECVSVARDREWNDRHIDPKKKHFQNEKEIERKEADGKGDQERDQQS